MKVTDEWFTKSGECLYFSIIKGKQRMRKIKRERERKKTRAIYFVLGARCVKRIIRLSRRGKWWVYASLFTGPSIVAYYPMWLVDDAGKATAGGPPLCRNSRLPEYTFFFLLYTLLFLNVCALNTGMAGTMAAILRFFILSFYHGSKIPPSGRQLGNNRGWMASGGHDEDKKHRNAFLVSLSSM